jgi:hypothetical protein
LKKHNKNIKQRLTIGSDNTTKTNKNYCQHGFGKSGALVLNRTFVQGSTAVILLNFCADFPPERKFPNRFA